MKRLVIIAIVYVVVLSMGYMGYNLYMIDKRMETLEQMMQPPVTQPLKQKTPVDPQTLTEFEKSGGKYWWQEGGTTEEQREAGRLYIGPYGEDSPPQSPPPIDFGYS